jgi:hypothetical protein
MSSWPAKIPVAVAAVSSALGLGLFWPVQAHEAHAVSSLPGKAQQPAPVAQAPDRLLLPGVVIVDARRDLRIVAREDGVIEAPAGGFAVPGQKIAAGQVLARLRPVMPQPERRDLGVELAGAHRDAHVSRLQVDRYKLDGTQPFDIKLPTPTLQLLADYRSAQVREAQLKRAADGEVLIVAPRAGVVVRSTARAGEIVVAGQSLFELNTAAGLSVSAEYPDHDIDSSRAQQALTTDHQLIELKLLDEVYDPDLRLRRAYYAVEKTAVALAPGEPVQIIAHLKGREAQ